MNKLMARIVAVVLAVMMLGTVSFAATTATKNAITTDIATQAMYTVKATAGTDIIAMYQDTEAPGTIAINPEKVGDNKFITVEYGGVENGHVSQQVQISGTAEETAVEVSKTYTDKNGLVYEGAAVASKTFSPDGRIAKKVGYKLTAVGGTYTGANVVDISSADEEAEGTTFSGEGSITFEVILLNVPAGVNVTAVPYIEY